MRRAHTFSRHAVDAARFLGSSIAQARLERRWTMAELAQRAGASVSTVRSVERGELTVAIGIYFELATLVGIDLFDMDTRELSAIVKLSSDRLALLPSRARQPQEPIDDDF